jgi:glyoxylase-like metal-dependent hydrolase (beta-lactamase superfamily II)
LLAVVAAGQDGAADEGKPTVSLRELVAGVHVALQPEAERFNDANSILIETERELLLVDLPSKRNNALAILEQATALAADRGKKVRFLINTHWHSDHSQSNYLAVDHFAPEGALLIVGHETLVEEIPERAGAYIAEQITAYDEAIPAAQERLARGVGRDGASLDEDQKKLLAEQIADAEKLLADLKAVRVEAPTMTFDGQMALRRTSGDLELRSYRAHTRGDTVVYLPKQKVLLTGDVLDDLPYGGHGYPRSWLAALEELSELDFERIVPGHGPVFDATSTPSARQALERIRALLRFVIEQTDRCSAQELDLEPCQESIDLERHRAAFVREGDEVANRSFDQFAPSFIERAWREATGQTGPPEH